MGTKKANHWNRSRIAAFVFILCFHGVVAPEYAKYEYFMDSSTDCHKSDYIWIKTDGVVNIYGRTPNGSPSGIGQCTLRFRPETIQDIMDIQFNHFSISDADVTLHVDLRGGGTHTLFAGSSKPNQLTSEGGLATISLTRLDLSSVDYSFNIVIRVYKKDDGQLGVDDSPGPVGLVVGLIVGILAFLIFLAVLGVCCYRRKKQQHLAHRYGRNYKDGLAEDAISPSDSYGLDNAAQRGMFPSRQYPEEYEDYERYSPRSKHKLLLGPEDQFDYRDRSESDSDSKDQYIMNSYDRSPRKTTSMRYEDENSRNVGQEGKQSGENNYNEESFQQTPTQPSRSPKPNAQHENPRFRPEREVNKENARMRDDKSDFDSESDASNKDRMNKVNSSISQESEPLEKTLIKPYPLPPVSKSPKSSAHHGNTSINYPPQQDTSRNIQPYLASSSSSLETEQTREGVCDEKPPPPSVSEDKPDTRHTLRPDRTKKKNSPEKSKTSPDTGRKEAMNSPEAVYSPEAKPPKSKKEKSKTDRTPKSDRKDGSRQETPEYEGRFKKAESAKKSKSKTPRIGRSRSAGNALDDTDSIGRGSVSSAGGYRAVPSVTADDYEDSDVESNYNPLRRSSSKTSLYASRSSLYGRRRRKNSVGGSVYSLAYDEADHFDRGSVRERSLSRRHRGFRSVGDLEMELREQATRSTQTLRETATQTRSRKNSVSSTSGRSKSRDRKNSTSSTTGRPKRAKSESELRRKVREAEEDKENRAARKDRPIPRPKPKPRKSTTMDDDQDSVKTGTAGGSDLVSSEGMPVAQPPVMPAYVPQGYPGYTVGYPGQMPYMQAPGQPPVMLPYGPVPGAVVPIPGAVVPIPGAVVPSAAASGPATAPKPSLDKWEMLCRITDAAKERDGESVAGSVFSNP